MIKDFRNVLRQEIGSAGWGAILFAIIMCGKTLGFGGQWFYPFSFLALVLAALANISHKVSFDSLSLIFLLYLPLTIVVNDVASIFDVWNRYLFFVVLFVAVSPLINSSYAVRFKESIFKVIILLCCLIASVSFVCYFIGVNLVQDMWHGGYQEYTENTAGTFGGITSHSMLLGPISGIGTLGAVWLATDRKHWYYYVLAVMCAGALLFSASRSSLIATLCALGILLFFSSRNKGKSTRRILGIILALVVSFPVWDSALKGLNAKNEGALTEGVNVNTRGEKWEIRLEEWKDSPVFGIGFCAVSERDAVGAGGRIEPGSSWLALLSMTGIIGFSLFVAVFIRGLRNTLRQWSPRSALIGAVLVLLGIHMTAEGHIFSAGSFLCMMVWLTLSCATEFRLRRPVVRK